MGDGISSLGDNLSSDTVTCGRQDVNTLVLHAYHFVFVSVFVFVFVSDLSSGSLMSRAGVRYVHHGIQLESHAYHFVFVSVFVFVFVSVSVIAV